MSTISALPVVTAAWDELATRLLHEECPELTQLYPLVNFLRHHDRFGQLFPLTSISRLCLSRTTRHPYVIDCPLALNVGQDRYRVTGLDGVPVYRMYQGILLRDWEDIVLGEGNLQETVAMIELGSSPEIGPTIDGDEDDLRRAEGKYVMTAESQSLHLAAFCGDEAETSRLLSNGSTDVNVIDYAGFTPLMKAASSRKVGIVRLLLILGADINARNAYGENAMTFARCGAINPEIIDALVAAGIEE